MRDEPALSMVFVSKRTNLTVEFDHVLAVRILDEMVFSCSEFDGPKIGLSPQQFAYSVLESEFLAKVGESFIPSQAPAQFCFVSLNHVVDVVANRAPKFIQGEA